MFPDITSLDKLSPGQRGMMIDYAMDSPLSRRLIELGFTPGREVQLVRVAPLRDPIVVQVGRTPFRNF